MAFVLYARNFMGTEKLLSFMELAEEAKRSTGE